jgi:hypothetical protein
MVLRHLALTQQNQGPGPNQGLFNSTKQTADRTRNDKRSAELWHVWDVHRPYGPHRMGAVSLCAVLFCTRGVKVGDAELRMVVAMSALPPKADIHWRERHVRFVPIADIDRTQSGR